MSKEKSIKNPEDRHPMLDQMSQLWRNKIAVVGLVIVIIFVLAAIFAPSLSPHDRSQIQLLEDLREKIKTRRAKQHDTFRQLALGFKLSQFEVCLKWVQTEARPFIEKIG